MTIHADDPQAPRRPIPGDVKKAVEFMRQALGRQVSVADLVRHCGVAERTLSQHFRTFFEISPMRYMHRLRLAAAREALLAGEPGASVTGISRQYGFNHQGRFAAQYRRYFGESPSATLRSARAAPAVDTAAEAQPALGSRERPSIAVVPCRTLAHEPMLRGLAESIAEEVGAALCSFHSLAVTVPNSHLAATRDAGQLAREFGVRYVLTGRIDQVGSRLRCVLRLVESAGGLHVWGEAFDGGRDQPFALRDRVVAGTVQAILPSIRGAEIERAQRGRPQNLDVHGLAMRALPLVFASRPEATRHGLEFLHRAIEIAPDYGLATSLAAWGHGQLVMYNGTLAPAEDRAHAMQLVHRAAILDDDDPLALTARCAVHTMAGEFDVAEALVTRALARDPTSGWTWGRSAWLHSYRGASDTAIEHFRRAVSLDASSGTRANSFAGIGGAHFNAGRYEAATFWLRRALREQPGTVWPNRSLAVSFARIQERSMALQSLDALRRYHADLTVGQVVASVPFGPDFLNRLGDGLGALGLPP